VFGDTGDRVLAFRLGAKEIADVVRHVDQVLCAAHVGIIGSRPILHGFSQAATRPEFRPTVRLEEPVQSPLARSRRRPVMIRNNSAPRVTSIDPTMASAVLLVMSATAIPIINSGAPTTNSQN
jgi:hypothetical protein